MNTDRENIIEIPMPIRTWLIEDHAVYRTNLAEALNSHETIQCDHDFSSCEEALEALQASSKNERPHVVLVDLALPGMNGTEGIKCILKQDATIKCVVVTVSENRKTVFDAIAAGAAGYLLKDAPFDRIVQGALPEFPGCFPMHG
jgi:DNA-binding NarL/FixJ family response regulator